MKFCLDISTFKLINTTPFSFRSAGNNEAQKHPNMLAARGDAHLSGDRRRLLRVPRVARGAGAVAVVQPDAQRLQAAAPDERRDVQPPVECDAAAEAVRGRPPVEVHGLPLLLHARRHTHRLRPLDAAHGGRQALLHRVHGGWHSDLSGHVSVGGRAAQLTHSLPAEQGQEETRRQGQ